MSLCGLRCVFNSAFHIPHSAFVFILILVILNAVFADITVRTLPGGKTVTVPSFEKDGAEYVSLTGFAQAVGFKHAQGAFSRRHTFTNSSGKIVFAQDNQFYTVDTATALLPLPPIRRDGALYLPAPNVVSAFAPKFQGTLSWNEKAKVITANALSHNIITVRSEVKQNGTVATITLADSLAYESTYSHPNVVISFKDGKVDPKAVRAGSRRTGVIDSIFTRQHEGSAQVSFILNHAIETPHIDYNRAKNTMMISLRPRVEQQRKTPAQPVDDMAAIRTVVIDPGHGGRDPGAIGPTGVQEKDVVLAISLELRKMLEKAGLTVHMTRDKDVFVPLTDRTKFANEKKADLFVSVHANAVEGDKKRRDAVKGYKIYFLSQAKNEEDKMSAMRENAVIQFEDADTRKNYDALQNVLISILGTEHLRESQDLSILMEQTFASTKTNIRRQQLGVGQANFWVLNGAYMPAVLVEVGFISNNNEEKLLSDKRIQYQKAAAISEAIIKFKKQLEGQ